MEDLLTCSVCFEIFDTADKVPLSLICGHTFCKACLVSMRPKKNGIVCPLDSTLDPREVSLIPKNYSLIEIISLAIPKTVMNKSKFLNQTKEIIESCRSGLDILQNAKNTSIVHKNQSKSALNDSFNQLRELLNYRESELLHNIDSTHTVIEEKIENLSADLQKLLVKHEENYKIASQYRENSEIDLEKMCRILPNLEKIDEILTITQKLPVKVLTSLNQIENSVQSFTKVIDDTQTRVSDYKVVFVADIRIKDRAKFLPSSTFVKTWRIRNDGELAWPNGCWCVFSHGVISGESVVVDPAWPSEEVDVSVVLCAPKELGMHKSYWKLIDPTGLTFGPMLCVEIEVYNVE